MEPRTTNSTGSLNYLTNTAHLYFVPDNLKVDLKKTDNRMKLTKFSSNVVEYTNTFSGPVASCLITAATLQTKVL
jgi:hypothetical protein